LRAQASAKTVYPNVATRGFVAWRHYAELFSMCQYVLQDTGYLVPGSRFRDFKSLKMVENIMQAVFSGDETFPMMGTIQLKRILSARRMVVDF
jgi:hypothetical protein